MEGKMDFIKDGYKVKSETIIQKSTKKETWKVITSTPKRKQ